MIQLDEIKQNIHNMEDTELAERLRDGQFSEEARPIAEEEYVNRGYKLSNESIEETIRSQHASVPKKPYKPMLLPFLFAIFATIAGSKLGAVVYGAIGAGIGAAVFVVVGWYLASNIAKFTRQYSKLIRFLIQSVAFIVWAIVCSVLIALGVASR